MQGKSPRSSGKGRSRKADSREELLDAALQIIAEHGIDALRIEDVCEKVGVTKGSLYWHFQDRQGLIRAAMLEQLRRIAERQLQLVDRAVDAPISRNEYLLTVAGALANPFDPTEVESRWQRWELLATARRDPEVQELMTEIQRSHQQYLTGIATKAQQRGILRGDVDPAAVAAAITAIALGSNHLWYLGNEGPTQEAWNGLLVKMIDMLFPPN
ncbi:MAG: TetR/AcrR family transcriptional regulator [Ilumatobacteraceae bacterium]